MRFEANAATEHNTSDSTQQHTWYLNYSRV